MSDAAPKPFVFDSFVATDKNISFLSGGRQFVADVEKFDEMNPANTNNGRYNHWNVVNEEGKILHNLFSVDEFKPRSAVFTAKRGDRSGTQADRLDVRPPLSGCDELNLCQQTKMFFTLDALSGASDIKSDIRRYVEDSFTVQTESAPEGIELKRLVLETSGQTRHDEELRKYTSVKYMYHGHDTVHDALLARFAPSGDFRTPNEDYDVGSGWQYLKSFKADEHIAIFNDIFDGQEVTLFADAVSTKTYYDRQYSVDGREYVEMEDGREICLNTDSDIYGDQYVTDAVMIDDRLGYTVVYLDDKKDWVQAFPDDPLSHNIFEFTMKKCAWLDQSKTAMSFNIVNETGLVVEKVPYAYLSHRGSLNYQVGAQCIGGTLKVRFSLPYNDTKTLDEFKEWIGTIGTLKLKHNPSLPDADAKSVRFISLNGLETWNVLASGVLEATFVEKSCDAFMRRRSLAKMPVKLTYIGASEKDFTQSVPFNSMTKNTFSVSGAELGMADAALAGKCEVEGDSTTVTIRLRFWRGSYDVTTAEEARKFFERRPLLIKLPRAKDADEGLAVQRRDRFFMDRPHRYDVENVRDYRRIDVCGPMLYMIYRHCLKTESETYYPISANSEGFIPMTVYRSNMVLSGSQLEPDDIETLIADPDRDSTEGINVYANYETAESVEGINRLGTGSHNIKSNVFSVAISNLGLGNNTSLSEGDKERIRRWITEKVNGIAKRLAPANTQLFKTFIDD